jgi:hypothetical protein
MLDRLPFREIWVIDFEFRQPDGEPVEAVHCMVAREMRSGRTLRLWRDELGERPPFDVGSETLVVAYMAAAEMHCFLALGWQLPDHILDAYVEFRNHTNKLARPFGASLLGAMQAYGLPHADMAEKQEMRDIAIRGAPFTEQEKRALLAYCETDVEQLSRLAEAMLPRILMRRGRSEWVNLMHALVRGRYMADVAMMERTGVPLDVEQYRRVSRNWEGIKLRLIVEVDRDYNVFEDTTFKTARFEAFVKARGIPWPRLPSGALDLAKDTFREMARGYPVIAPLHELRATLGGLRLSDLAVGRDGRNRAQLRPFSSSSSRNQPSTSRFIFGPATWIRGLIVPPPGKVLAYLDWSAQEIGIAAALSGDTAMMADYRDDPYLGFAKRIGLAPHDATKTSHKDVRNAMKPICLGANYGMGARTMASRTGRELDSAARLLGDHRRTYRDFWRWAESAVDHASLCGYVETLLGWNAASGGRDANPRSLQNFPVQANAAEMMRLAAHDLVAAGFEVCAPVHDAMLILVPESGAEELVHQAAGIMVKASAVVLGGFEIRVGGAAPGDLVRHPHRYMDPRGVVMWNRIQRIVDDMDGASTLSGGGPLGQGEGVPQGRPTLSPTAIQGDFSLSYVSASRPSLDVPPTGGA